MLIDPDTVGPTLSRVQALDFTTKQYRTIFQAIQALFRAGKPVDGITVRETVGGGFTQLLANLIDATPTAANLDAYIDLLKRSAMNPACMAGRTEERTCGAPTVSRPPCWNTTGPPRT